MEQKAEAHVACERAVPGLWATWGEHQNIETLLPLTFCREAPQKSYQRIRNETTSRTRRVYHLSPQPIGFMLAVSDAFGKGEAGSLDMNGGQGAWPRRLLRQSLAQCSCFRHVRSTRTSLRRKHDDVGFHWACSTDTTTSRVHSHGRLSDFAG